MTTFDLDAYLVERRALVDKAAGYGVEGHAVDGTDLSACLHTLTEAVGKARQGHGPQMVVARLLRLCGGGIEVKAQRRRKI